MDRKAVKRMVFSPWDVQQEKGKYPEGKQLSAGAVMNDCTESDDIMIKTREGNE